MPNRTVDQSAELLVLAALRAEYAEKQDLRLRAHQDEIEKLPRALAEECRNIERSLSPLFRIQSQGVRINLYRIQDQEPMAYLILNLANEGEIGLQLFSQVRDTEARKEVTLQRFGADDYRWKVASEDLSTEDLAAYCVSELLNYAANHVRQWGFSR